MEEFNDEKEVNNIDLFSNYSAADVFVQGIAGAVNQEDIAAILDIQTEMYEILFNIAH